jgi:hypothetical protein
MATVRFSKELQDEIIKNARAVFNKQLQEAQDSRPDATAWGEKIYGVLFGQHVVALNAVPQEFLNIIDTIDVGRVGEARCNLRFNFLTPKPWPRKFNETEYAKSNSGYNSSEIVLKNHLVWGELFAEVKAWNDRQEEAKAKCNAFVEQVKKIIEAHATLSPALKMWPPLWDLIPESYKSRHREVVERTKKDVEVNVDLGAMTAAVVAHKITR